MKKAPDRTMGAVCAFGIRETNPGRRVHCDRLIVRLDWAGVNIWWGNEDEAVNSVPDMSCSDGPPVVHRYLPIYKYVHNEGVCRKIDIARQVIADHSFWFSNQRSCNDPFECAPFVRFTPAQLSSNSSIFPAHVHDAVFSSSTARDKLSRNLRNDFGRHGICCFSKNPVDVRMWAHYGDAQQGFAVGVLRRSSHDLVRPDGTISRATTQPVIYNRKYPHIDSGADFNDDETRRELFKAFLLAKGEEWTSENEYRIIALGIVPPGENGSLQRLDSGSITEISLGLRCPDHERKRIMDLVEQFLPHCSVYQIEQAPDRFEVTKLLVKKGIV